MPADHQAGPITRGLLIVKPPIALVEVFQKLKFLGLARLLLDIEIDDINCFNDQKEALI